MKNISVIVPVYNVEQYLSQCIDSILSQTFKDFELILIDDGSSDKSPVICDNYALKDNRVIVFHQKNGGVSLARNKGIDVARGNWITFIDADDWVGPNYLSNFQTNSADNINLIIQGLEYYDQRNNRFYKQFSLVSSTLTSPSFQSGFSDNKLLELGFPVGKAYRKDLLMHNKLRFDTRISYHEDHIFVLDYYLLCHTIRLSSATDYKYRCFHNATSLSSKHYSYNKMELAGDEMLKRINKMYGLFCERMSVSAKNFTTFAYQCKMIASRNLIYEVCSYSERKKTFRQIIKKSELAEYFFPNAYKDKISKFIYLNMPYFIIETYNIIYGKAKNILKW